MPKELMTPRMLIYIAYYGFFAGLLYMALQYLLTVLMLFCWRPFLLLWFRSPEKSLLMESDAGKNLWQFCFWFVFIYFCLALLFCVGGQIIAAAGDK